MDDVSEDATLSGHRSVGEKPTRFQRRYLLAAILNIGVMIACSVGGYVVGRSSHNGMWNFDSVDIVPSAVREALLQPETAKSFTRFTMAPFVRDEGPDLADHPWLNPPGPQQDRFFQSLAGHGKVFLVSAQDMRRMGKDPSKYARIGEDWGYGDKIYPARFDHTHQLHCIHALLRDTNSSTMEDPLIRRHFDHCLWAIYDYISCHVTLDVYNFMWVQDTPRPWPDHASQRRCRATDPLDEFYNANDVSTDERIRYLVPQDGDYVHPISAEHKGLNDIFMAEQAQLGELMGNDWLRERRKRFDEAMVEWRRTGKIPRATEDEKGKVDSEAVDHTIARWA
ncbi:hypothetical protein DOTSEDRAFT_20846 [Dothistroma septosporum NZE10]|uniref:Uncharacterized protein n=1 Tax=Dothistroma septosporum (strain NZE10 / CBS 128990) TaxID=675120 RepID=N1PU90_DOTSN|nr:hypothetical protein DOTSEDRAFT_20846 [Dothistroma septosporum NZE10]